MRRTRRVWPAASCTLILALVVLQAACTPAKTPAESPPPGEKPGESVAQLPEVPLGLPPVPVPADNPMTPEKVKLGKLLYFDKRVSQDGTISCATCHDPQMAWAEHEPTSTGIKDAHGEPQMGGRNSPTVINAAYATSQFWDGREPDLEAQAIGPVGNPIEMGHTMEAVVEVFAKIPGYERLFQEAFGSGVTEKGFAQAIAAFERTVLSGNSPYDQFKAGDDAALDDVQKEGLALFTESCANCHTPPLFSNYRFYNAGVGMDKEDPDKGRMAVTDDPRHMGAFRVPALREVANTAPYFHDGSVPTLEEAVALMAGGGKDNANLSAFLKSVREAELTEEDQAKIVEFLKALSGEFPKIAPPEKFPQ
ncbi:MAG TPA: cytochrome c peroxidase [Thermoguttaceae bacterium]|nr:cytochrome c peroxidase [Thermoguttaceae bacterium]